MIHGKIALSLVFALFVDPFVLVDLLFLFPFLLFDHGPPFVFLFLKIGQIR